MKFYFTFGSGQVGEGTCQIIEANNMHDARETMFQKCGDKWAFAYTEEQWEENKKTAAKYGYQLEVPLPKILHADAYVCKECDSNDTSTIV